MADPVASPNGIHTPQVADFNLPSDEASNEAKQDDPAGVDPDDTQQDEESPVPPLEFPQ